jgi:hypothetical protein
MNRRVLLGGFLVVVALAVLWGVWFQRNQLADLRAQQQQLLAQPAATADPSASPGTADSKSADPGTPPPTMVATPEILRLRGEVTRLTERKREFAGVRAENERLHAQLASRGTNAPAGLQLPPGYMRKSEARMVGYSTPDDTLQSLLWAIQHRDLTNILQAFAPDRAQQLRDEAAASRGSSDDFFSQSAGLPGMRILRREPATSDGSIAMEVEVVPDEPVTRVTFRQFNGQWKIIDGPF